jgi:4-nitrophenol 2-monooxygenase / 4-nitrocatechol 4-monooxygenase, reductase component
MASVGYAQADERTESGGTSTGTGSTTTHCDREVFRNVIGHFATGVTIVTARDGGADFGVTANAVTSVSLEPPTLLVCLNRKSRTQSAVSRSKAFAVNILSEDQGDLAVHFASAASDKFGGIMLRRGNLGSPLLDRALAHLECWVIEEVSAATHAVYLAGVQRAEAFAGAPLAYFRGRFGRLELEQEVPGGADILDPTLTKHFHDALSFFMHG